MSIEEKYDEVRQLIQVGKEKGYALILERRQAGVVYGAPEVDVTEEVIKAFDDETRKAKK